MSEFEFERINTIKGYPELHWTGKRPYRGTDYYPAQLKEKYGEMKDEWINKIFWGDNLQVMSHMLREYRGKIDLIYIDPPFDSKADYKKTINLKGKKVNSDSNSFEEKQYADIWTNDEYLQFMYERLILLKELLKNQGVIYIHCDYRKVSHLRIICDEIFGPDNFLNQITWRRQVVRGMKTHAKYYAFSSDFILIYAKNANEAKWFRQIRTNKLTIEEAEKKYMKDERGYFRTSDPGSYTFESLCKLNEQGLLYAPKNGEIIIDYQNRVVKASKGGKVAVKYYREMDDDEIIEEITIDNIWDDIQGMGVVSSEFIGYPTQKPEKLLQRVIEASTEKGDIVFDCFMGSGTTQAVAMKLGRKFIGADINLGAVQTTTKRLINIAKNKKNDDTMYTGFEVYNVNNYDFFRNPVEAKDLLIDALGIQKFSGNNVYDGELDGRMVKIMPVNRIATKSDLEELKANMPYQKFEKRKNENPLEPVERLTIICMGHEPDLKPSLERDLINYNIDIEIIDILKDKANLQFKRDSEAVIEIEDNKLNVKEFYPMNLLQKLSLQKEYVEDWRQMVESIMIDWNYDGAGMEPKLVDIAEKDSLVKGIYEVPSDATNIKIKITDLLSETYEKEIKINE